SARVSTGDLNRVVRQTLEQQPPPLRQNRRAKVFYGTQAATNPPTIVLFTNGPQLLDNTYQRYLLKSFRDHLPFGDVPIKLYLRHKHGEDRPSRGPELVTVEEKELSKRRGSRTRSPLAKGSKSPRSRKETELWQD